MTIGMVHGDISTSYYHVPPERCHVLVLIIVRSLTVEDSDADHPIYKFKNAAGNCACVDTAVFDRLEAYMEIP